MSAAVALPTTAAGCVMPASTEEHRASTYDAVFTGTVVGFTRIPAGAYDPAGDTFVWTVRTDDVARGEVPRQVSIVTRARPLVCVTNPVRDGQSYVFFAFGAGDALRVMGPERTVVAGTPAPRYPRRRLGVPVRGVTALTLSRAVAAPGLPIYGVEVPLPLATIEQQRDRVRLVYSTCGLSPSLGTPCRRIDVVTVRGCRFAAMTPRGRLGRAPWGRRGGAVVLRTGRQEVRVWGTATTAQARDVIATVRAINRPRYPAPPLPAPAPCAVPR